MKNKILSVKDILEKKKLIEKLPSNYYSDFFNAEIEIGHNIPKESILDITKNTDGDDYRTYQKLIYLCCPIFKSAELREEFDDIKEPYDIIDRVFVDNIGEVIRLGNFIMQKYGFIQGDLSAEIKKQ